MIKKNTYNGILPGLTRKEVMEGSGRGHNDKQTPELKQSLKNTKEYAED